MNKNEARYFSTAARMDEALIKLLEKKDFEYITIKEICDVAQVNRSTFYLHYENTTDLLEETTKYIIDRHLEYFDIDKAEANIDFRGCDANDIIFVTPEYLTPYLTYIKENRKVFKTSLKHFGSFGFEKVYRRMYNFLLAPILERFGFEEGEREYVAKFYLTGVTALMMEWIERDCIEPIDKMIEIIIKCTVGKISNE